MTARVFHAELWGKRQHKYDWLAEHSVEDTKWTKLDPAAPLYLFRPYNVDAAEDYHQWPAINKLMPVNSVGIVTSRDGFVIDFDRDILRRRIDDFISPHNTDPAVRARYLRDGDKLDIPLAREQIREDANVDQFLVPILYRPFDCRFIFYHDAVIERSRRHILPQMLRGTNLGVIARRQMVGEGVTYFFASNAIIADGVIRSDNRGSESLFPLYLYPNVGKVDQRTFEQWPEGKDGRRSNLDPGFVNDLADRIGLTFISDGRGDLKKIFGPEDVLHYIYAVFHCPTYRKRYAQFLKLDFPRVPLTGDRKQFRRLCKLGAELTALHLLEAESLTGRSIGYPVAGTDNVEKGYPKYVPPGAAVVRAGKNKLDADKRLGRVYINPRQFFEGVDPAVWGFQIGGYQVAEKWLKDRRERTLAHDDISRYTKIVEALRGTIRLMAAIDEAIPYWPMK